MGRKGLAVFCLHHALSIAMVRCDQQRTAALKDGPRYLTNAVIYRLGGLDRCRKAAGMTVHIGIGVIH